MTQSSVQELNIGAGKQLLFMPERVRPLHSSVEAWMRTRAQQTLTTETITEVVLLTSVLSFVGWFFFALHCALHTFTIAPMP